MAGSVERIGARPLQGLRLVEQAGPASTALGRTAVGFTTMLAAQWGAEVRKVEELEERPGALDHACGPWLPDGSSALDRFLSRGKSAVAPSPSFPAGTWLVTDDAALAEAWPDERLVLLRPNFDDAGEGSRPQSELTAMAVSGLLDIVGDVGRPPLPFPGHQVAYAAGLAALAGLLAGWYAEQAQGRPERAEVSAVDAAAWLNWKNRLSSVSGNRQTGRDRKEEWRAVRCRDGYIAVIFRDRDVADMAKLLRLPELDTPHFIQEKSRVADLDTFHRLVAEALAGRGKDEVLAQAADMGLQFSAVLEAAEVLDDPQSTFRGFFVDDRGLRVPRPPVLWGEAA
jgi:crotonobetainyl-CoA:carnitine CoA-transferase CaiB-like acyl-CoA transferase